MKDYSSIVVCSKVKFLRNLVGFEFPSMLDGVEGIKVLNKLADTILALDDNYKLYKMKTLPELDVNIMREKKLISNRLLDAVGYGAVVLSSDEAVSIMINESDHLCEQCKLDGLALIAAHEKLNNIDSQILSKLDIAYDDSIGFLTSDILNVGTGFKAGITLFLPALTIEEKIKDISASLANQGIDFAINEDEDIGGQAYYYTLQNAQTIGKKESDYVVKLTEIAIKIAEMEVRARTELLSFKHIDDVKDKVFRAWGILTNCFKIDVDEAGKLIGELKMGVALDLIKFKNVEFLDKLIVDIQPYSLTKISGSSVAGSELDKYRAGFLERILKAKRIK